MEKKLIITPFFLFFVLNCHVFGLGQPSAVSSNYVVIGAFAIPQNATEFVEKAKKIDLQAQFAMNPNRKLLYVYILETDDKTTAFAIAKKMRMESPYNDTWVYSGFLGDGPFAKGSDVNPESGEKLTAIPTADLNSEPSPIVAAGDPAAVEPEVKASTPPVIDEAEAGKLFFFKIISSVDQEPVNGEVDIIDLERTRKASSYRANEDVRVKSVNKSGNIAVNCEVFGYKAVQKSLNYADPAATEGVEVNENKVVVPFELVRLQKGDIAVMYNVYFFKDAAIIRPESRYEVGNLLDMLKENPKYKIRIHGHANGSASGKIISVKDDNDLFSLTDTKEGYGSSKKLSEERAKVIQTYLLREGIDQKRMQIKAWGGKRPIYEKNSNQAQSNVRVEIEILEN